MAGHLDMEGKEDLSSKEIENIGEETVPPCSPEEEAALVRKVDLMLLPTMWVMYLLSYMDRTKYVGVVPFSDLGVKGLILIPICT